MRLDIHEPILTLIAADQNITQMQKLTGGRRRKRHRQTLHKDKAWQIFVNSTLPMKGGEPKMVNMYYGMPDAPRS
jgi:hypothetical protein